MKRFLIISTTLLCFISCEKKDSLRTADGIQGKWKLTESLADPGDGSGTWMQANRHHPSYIEFNTDNSMTFTPSDNNDTDHYQVLSDSTMILLRGSQQFQYRYKLSGSTLTLYPPCFEACGSKYIAVQ